MQEYMKNRRMRRRQDLLDLRNNKCEKCGSSESLEFNHIDRSLKLFTLSGSGLDKNWDKILEELKKCELLCKEHHREYTRKQYKEKEILIWNQGKYGEYIHGTMRRYHEENCRCDLCKLAKKKYRNKEIKYSEIVE